MILRARDEEEYHSRVATTVPDLEGTSDAPRPPDGHRHVGRSTVTNPRQRDHCHLATGGVAQAGQPRLDPRLGLGRDDVRDVGDHPGRTARKQWLWLLSSGACQGNQLERREGADTFDHVQHTIGTGVPEGDVERYQPPESP
jgi:hypothetical protein